MYPVHALPLGNSYMPYSYSCIRYGYYSLLTPIHTGPRIAPSSSAYPRALHRLPHHKPSNPNGPQLLSPHVLLDPPAVARNLTSGGLYFTPLSLITNAKRRPDMVTSQHTSSALTITNGQINVKSNHLDASGDSKMTENDFREGSTNLVEMMGRLLLAGFEGEPPQIGGAAAKEIAVQFATHFATITSAVDFHAKFSIWVNYDTVLRRAHANHSDTFDIAVFQKNIWDQVVQQDMNTRIDAAMNSSRAPSTAPSASTSSRRSTSQRTFRDSSQSASAGSPSAANRVGRRDNGWKTYSNTKCMFCGVADGHHYKRCTNPPKFLTKNAAGRWEAADNKLICFSFNGPVPCAIPECNFSHTCSLCGNASHSAQSCSA